MNAKSVKGSYLCITAGALLIFLWAGDLFANGPTYDGDRVLAHIEMLAATIGVRQPGSANEGRAAAYIAGEFVKLGLDTRIQAFPAWDYYSQNVIATRPGLDERAGILYIGAHYDSVQWGPGANDNASGSALLLELARLLSSTPISPTLTFVAFGSEERGLGGSWAFVAGLPPLDRLMAQAMFNMDCVGWGVQQGIGIAREQDRELAERIAGHALDLGLPVAIERVRNSDHASFSDAGIPAAILYSYDPDESAICGPFYHGEGDTVETLDPTAMANVASILLAAIADLANDPPTKTPATLWLPAIHRQQMD